MNLPLTKPYPKSCDVVIDVHLTEILDGIDALNDYAEDVILGADNSSCLEDISFQVVGGESNGNEYIGGTVKIRVQAKIFNSYEDEDEDDWDDEDDLEVQ